jgi:hypothetical protein
MAKARAEITWNVTLTHQEMQVLYKVLDKLGFLREKNVELSESELETLALLAAQFSGVNDFS